MPVNPYHARLAISQYGEQFRAELFTEDLGDTDGDLLPADWQQQFDKWMTYLQGGGELRASADAEVGGQLFEWVFGRGANRGKWDEILGHLGRQPGRPVRLLIDTSALGTVAAPDKDRDRIHNLPYGLLFDPQHSYFLFRPGAGRPPIQFVRIIRRCTPRPLNLHPEKKPVRLLLAAAEPDSPDVPPFGCAGRLRQLAAGLAQLPAAFELFLCTPGGVRALGEAVPGVPPAWTDGLFEPLSKTTRAALAGALAGGDFDVLHLMAHGRDNGVLLCAADGGPDPVTGLNLREWCGQSRLQLAFLQVCKAGRTGGRGAFGGLAQELLNPHGGNLAAVVASPYPLEAGQSTEASLRFYEALAEGKSPDEAIVRGLDEDNWAWAFLELWVRPRALEGTDARGAYQYVSPYRGLASFKERDADIFCGRDAEVAELRQILHGEPVVAVVGDSGSGKSSLLEAGLAHTVRREGLAGLNGWRIVSLRPGAQPAHGLLRALLLGDGEADERPPAEVNGGVRAPRPGRPAPAEAPPGYEEWRRSLGELLAEECGPGRRLLILFDQFEEMVTLCKDEGQRRAVAEVLAAAAREGQDQFRLVLGIRSDYLGSVASLPGVTHLMKRPWVLRAPGPDDLRAIIAEPARRSGYEFEGAAGDPSHARGLLERILADPLLPGGAPAAGAPPRAATPLPLLEFALERLWLKAVGRGEPVFKHEDYDRFGGLGGAIAERAEEVYEDLPKHPELGPDSQQLAERIIRELITPDGTRRPRPRADLEAATGTPGHARAVIDHLVGERLLTIRSDADNLAEARVDLAHEVLIARWERLRKWLAADPETAALKQEFQDAADRWNRSVPGTPARSWWLLPDPGAGRRYLAWIDTNHPPLTGAQVAFVAAVRALIRRRRTFRAVGAVVLAVLAVGMTVLAVIASHNAEEARTAQGKAERAEEKTREQLYLANTSQAWSVLDEGNFQLAIDLLDDHLPEPGQSDLRRFEWYCLLRLCDRGRPIRRNGQVIRSPFTLPTREDMIRSLAFSPDGTTVAAAGWDGEVRLWDVPAQKPGPTLDVGGRVAAVAFSPGRDTNLLACAVWDENWQAVPGNPLGKVLLPGGPSGKVLLHDLTGKPRRVLELSKIPYKMSLPLPAPLPGGGTALAFTPDGKTLALGVGQFYPDLKRTNGNVVLVDVAGLQTQRVIPVPEHLVLSLAFSPDGHVLAGGTWKKEKDGSSGRVRRWDVATGVELPPLDGHKGGVTGVAFSRNGQALASSSWDHTVKVWDAAAGTEKKTLLGHVNRVWSVAFSPASDNDLASASLDGTVKLWDVSTGEERMTLRGHTSSVYSLAFSPDGKTLASGSWDRTVKLWDMDSERARASPLQHDDWVYCVAFSPDGKRLASGGVDTKVRVWDVATRRDLLRPAGREGPKGHAAPVLSVAFSPDGKTVASGSWDKTVRLWDVEAGADRTLGEHRGRVRPVAFAPDGKTLASGSEDGAVKLWDVATAKELKSFGVADSVNALAFAPDGKSLAVGTGDRYGRPRGGVKLWDLDTGAERTHIDAADGGAVTALAFAPDGRRLAFWSARFVTHDSIPGELQLWDLAGEPRGPGAQPSVKLFQQHVGSVSSLAFSPDGRTVASGAGDQAVKLWDVETGTACATLKGHKDRVMAVAFSPDGKTLATGSLDYTVRLWRSATDEDVIDFFKRLGDQELQETNWQIDLALACWGYYLHADRASADGRAAARERLEKGLQILKGLRPDGRRLTEDKQRAWVAEFEKALAGL
jgi:WD40 repeat protein